MAKQFAHLLLVIGMMLVGVGFVLAKTSATTWFILVVLGAGLVIWAFVIDGRHEKRVAEQRKNKIEQRTLELTAAPRAANQALAIKGDSGAPLFFIAALAGVGMVYASVEDSNAPPMFFLGGIFVSALFSFALFRALPGVGKPLLEMSPQGIRMPIHGFIAWREIGGISLSKHSHRGVTTYTLIFKIENYRRAVADIHWTERLLSLLGVGALRRGVVSVLLRNSSEEPETVYAVARSLWQQSTGRNHHWSPMFSAEYNQALRRLDEFRATHSPEKLSDRMQENPEKALQEMEQFRNDWNVLNAELSRRRIRNLWAITVAMIGMIIVILWPLLRRFL